MTTRRHYGRILFFNLILLTLLMTLPHKLWAQTATLTGVVSDQSAAVVPGVTKAPMVVG